MDYVPCRSCDGTGKKWFTKTVMRYDSFFGKKRPHDETYDVPCKACSGTGLNQKLYSVNCGKCGVTITFPRDSQYPPQYCKSCKLQMKEAKAAKWHERPCPGVSQLGCNNTIKYHEDWDHYPSLCKECSARKKELTDLRRANLREKPCPGYNNQRCGNTIRWDESKKPGGFPLCRECSDKKREAQKELTKPCAGGCGNMITYRAHWTNVSDFCKACEKRRKVKQEPNYSQNKRFYAACKNQGLSIDQINDFSNYLHSQPRFDVEKMSYDEIERMIKEYC